MDEHTICPWCQTEIVWDEEIGPEKHCPYCENELSGYRTVQIGIDRPDETDEEDDEDWERNSGQQHDFSEFRQYNRSQLAFEDALERIVDEQDEAPECPSCREYMMEAGTQTIPGQQFAPRTPQSVGEPLLTAPFRVVWYVCPSCFRTDAKLAQPEQERLVQLLTKAAEDGGRR
jgi:hypothetical protein